MAKKKEKDNEISADARFLQQQAVLDAVAAKINKQYGTTVVQREADPKVWQRISTGSIGLDMITNGGLPRGSVVELFGHESSGKTTLALNVAAEIQKEGGVVLWVDTEHSFDSSYAQAIGLDVTGGQWIFAQPATAEQALDTALAFAESGFVQLIVIDSIASLTPEAELEQDSISEDTIGLLARRLSKALRQLVHVLRGNEAMLLAINQIRDKIGFMQKGHDTPGGRALKFYSNMRVELRVTGQIKQQDEVVGVSVKAALKKNRTGPPFRETEYTIRFGEGIDKAGEILDMAVEQGFVRRDGAWFSYGDVKLQGRENMRRWLKDRPTDLQRLHQAVLAGVLPDAE